ncbi:DNA methylase N-4 [Spirochaetia bacterium]|nr:DNA methylase N-4 [Spirochaetia bacterium]
MNKPDAINLHTPDRTECNFAALAALFPNAVTEAVDANGVVIRTIDADVLRQEINTHVVEGKEERYQFTWPDKKKSVLLANAPIAATLRPCREESVNFNTTENLYIEGDNLDVLKLLQETYLNRVKMIYIDPPYNTGNDFVYADDFAEDADEFLSRDGQYDDDGNRMVRNLDSNGRFHTDWLNMIYPRLRLARDLLKDDGVIFISIDDNEVENLKKICNEVFSASNFEGHIHWRRRHNQPNDKTKMIGLVAEHIIVYSKNHEVMKTNGVGKIDLTGDFTNPDNDPRGEWASKPWKVGSDQSGSRYSIVAPNGNILDEEWMGEESTYKELLADNRIIFPRGGDGMPRKKYFRSEREEEGQCATNWWEHVQFGHNQGANDCITELFGVKNVFSNPKPVELIRGLIQIANAKKDDIILDFFAGSSTTAHAVMQINNEDSQKRKFILVQLKEDLDKSLETASGKAKAQLEVAISFLDSIGKLHLISEIGKERIRRAGAKIDKGDIGFRVLKLDSSNMKDVYYTPQEYTQTQLNYDGLVDNIKSDRTAEDLLFQVMIDLGIPLSSSIEVKNLDGKQVYYVNGGYLVACFESVNDKMVTAIAQGKPYYAVFRDSSFASDSTLVNFEQIFKTYSPSTIRKVL